MSTKTIAVDLAVYMKLARLKRESESFSKLIDRLVDEVVTSHTVSEVLSRLDDMPSLSSTDAEIMENVVQQNREDEDWSRHDLS